MHLPACIGQRPTSIQDLVSSNPRSLTRLKTPVCLLSIVPVNWIVPPKKEGDKIYTFEVSGLESNHSEGADELKI